MRVQVIRAWTHRHVSAMLELPVGTTVEQAARASGLPLDNVAGYAVFGQRCAAGDALHDGDRLELLQALKIDPKDARRLRAAKRAGRMHGGRESPAAGAPENA